MPYYLFKACTARYYVFEARWLLRTLCRILLLLEF
jgi:hypothetical protein